MSTVVENGADGERQGEGMEVFVASHAPRPRMIVFGAIDFAAALTAAGTAGNLDDVERGAGTAHTAQSRSNSLQGPG